MRNSKKVAAFLMALTVTSMNIPMHFWGMIDCVVYAEEAQEDIRIITHPSNYTGNIGENAVFSVVAEGGNLNYRWKVKASDDSDWTNTSMTGNKTSELVVPIKSTRNGYKFCCVITDENGNSVTSNVATLSIAQGVSIISQPQDFVGSIGENAVFSVVAEGSNLKYKWMVKTSVSANWKATTFEGCSSPSVNVPITKLRDGYMFYCIITDANGNSVSTNEVTLHTGATVTQQPTNYYGVVGDTAIFKVNAYGNELNYQWKVLTPGSTVWKNTSMSGNKTNQLSVPITKARDGYQFYCVVSDVYNYHVSSDIVTLTARESTQLSIVDQPIDMCCSLGQNAIFEVNAEGNGLKYHWKVCTTENGEWKDTNMEGKYTNRLIVPASISRNGYKFCCIITDSNGESLTSDAATLTIASPITLSTLDDIQITPDTDATFTIQATGTGELKYQWESSTDGTTWSTISGANEATLTVSGADAVNGTQYRCVVSDNYGQSKTSNAATLTVEAPADLRCGDDLTYTFDEAIGTLTLSGTGEMWSYTSAEASPFHDLDINTVIIPDGMTVIGAHAFEGTNISTVILPESVFSIRYKAFWDIDNLDITVENIGCAIYEDAISNTATVRGYGDYSAAYYCTTTEGYHMTYVNLDEEEFDTSTNKIVLTLGDTTSVNVGGKGTKYRSFNTDVVTVESNGTVTAVGEGETKVVAYDKQGKTVVFYYSVVSENAQPNNTWRYQIVSPASGEQSIWVPFSGERVSLNEDVAYIGGDWDQYAVPTGTYGTAPILSADDQGNSFIFYYTYDADVRPIEKEVTYTEKAYQINDEWMNAFYKPYYSFTADEDMRVYFKGYGSEDLDVAVYDAPGGNLITDDLSGGRAEVSFDVVAGQTVYIQPSSGQNIDFKYTMKLSTSAIKTVEMTDNEIYTVNPDTAGDLTTFAFTAPEAGTYLVESQSNHNYHYDLANNTDFTNVEYDDDGNQIEDSGWWNATNYSGDNHLMTYYPFLSEGETMYMRGHFDGETTTDDYISFRVHAVSTDDAELTVNDFENPNVLSSNPDDFDRRTLTGTEGTQYIITTDDQSVNFVIWDKDWNLISLYNEPTDNGYRYYLNCDENQVYHIMVIPQNVSDNYSDVKVWVSTDQELSLTLGNSYTIYNTNIDRVTYSYTPEESGIYVLNTEWNVGNPDDAEYLPDGHRFGVHLSKDTANEDDSSYREDIYTWWENADEPDYKYVYLNAGENYYFRFDQDQMQTSNITFSLTKETPTALTVDDVITETMAYDDVSNAFGGQWYSYTTSTEGNYLLTFTNDLIENEYEGQNYDSHIVIYKDNECIRDDWQNYNEFEQSIELGAGQTVLMYVAPSTENGLKYRLAIRDYNQPFNTNLLAGHTWENADNDYTTISSENAEGFVLNVTDVGEENWDTQAFIRDFPIFGSNYYKLTFNLDADTESENTPTVLLQQSHEPYTNYGEGHWINTNEETFTFCFAVDENGNSGLTKLLFDGFGIGTYEFSNVELVRITEEEYTELTRNYQPIQFQPTESENIEGMGNTFNGHTYAVIPYETDPITAQELCEANGGHLVTITSQAEQDFVASLAANVDYEQFWLGGSDNGSEGEWYWMNGETWDYTAWSTASEPNNGEGNGDENYLLMWRSRNYEWGDAYGEYDNHSTKLYFICEWDDENYGESTGEGGSEDVLIIDEE